MVAHSYMVRITHSYDACKALVDTWAMSCEKMVVYEHVGSVTEKVHIHLVIECSEYQKKWLRELGSRHGINLKGNKNCSFKEFDGNYTAMVYMTKGVYDPKYNKGYSESDVALWKSQWVQREESKDAMLYNHVFGDVQYIDDCYEQWCESNPIGTDPYHKFRYVKKHAYSQVLMLNGYIVNMKCINQYKMLVYSYCARNGLFIPDDDPAFKRLA